MTGLHEWCSCQQTFVREVRWVTSQKSLCETGEPILSTYLNCTRCLKLSMCLFIWARSTRLAHLTALTTIGFVFMWEISGNCLRHSLHESIKRRHLHCCSSERLKPIRPWPAHNRQSGQAQLCDLTCARGKDFLKNAKNECDSIKSRRPEKKEKSQVKLTQNSDGSLIPLHTCSSLHLILRSYKLYQKRCSPIWSE